MRKVSLTAGGDAPRGRCGGRQRRRTWDALLAMLVLAVTFGVARIASAADYQVCIKWSIDTIDSSQGIAYGPAQGLTEDQYNGCDSGCDVIARGVRIKAARWGFSVTKDADPVTGCASWSDIGGPGVYDLTVYGYATTALDTFVRIHTPSSEGCDEYPGLTYSALIEDAELDAGGSNAFTVPYASKWTAMATAAFSLYRIGWLEDKELHIALDSGDCTGGSAHIGDFNSFITSGIHCVELPDCTTPEAPWSRRKFVVAHELGHAMLALWYGEKAGASNGDEPSVDSDNGTTPNHCGTNGDSYGIGTKEYNSLGFREAWAHFVAARVWNDRASEGAFRWPNSDGLVTDLERYGPSTNQSGDNDPGGRLENFCCDPAADGSCGTSWASATTNEDWLRFLWDFYTTHSSYCPGGLQPGFDDMMNLYAETRLNGGLTATNYAAKMENASDEIGLDACLLDSYEDMQVHNGIDH